MNKIQCIIFDIDGVLTETKELHYECLNSALFEISNYTISKETHLKEFDGLSTKDKINKLINKGVISESDRDKIFELKQKETFKYLRNKIQKNEKLIQLFSYLKDEEKIKIYIATNSIRRSTHIILSNLGILEYIDGYVCNEDIKNPKPHAEIYLTAIANAGVDPREVLIIEDSPNGLKAARKTGANILAVRNPQEVSLNLIKFHLHIDKKPNTMFSGRKINIVIPAAGLGSRFEKAGYLLPKPLIEVFPNKPMIQVVTESLNIDARFIFIIQKEHSEKFNFKQILKIMHPTCEVIEIDGLTDGAARTILKAKEFINNEDELIVANSDQYIEWDSNDFIYQMNYKNADGGVLTFESNHPKWSYVKKDQNGNVIEVAEKNPISNEATIGVYWARRGSDIVQAIEKMIDKNIRTNGEFYFFPCYQQLIDNKKKIITYHCNKNMGLGTPEDLEIFKSQMIK